MQKLLPNPIPLPRRVKAIVTLLLLLCLWAPVSAKNISLSLKHVTVEQAVEYLHRNYDYSFIMNTDQVDITRIVTVVAKNASLESVLDQIFQGQSVEYRINGSTVSVIAKPQGRPASSRNREQVSMPPLEGHVTGDNDEPLVGATVIERGTTNGTTTDVDGNFRLRTTTESPVLVVSFMGYDDLVVSIAPGQSFVEAILRSVALAMNEVVVVGYGSMARRDITSAIGSFKPKEGDQRPVLGVDQLLQGHIAGVNISSSSGVPGATSRVSIRGIGSLNAGNEPLYVVDGIPLNSSTGDTGAWIGDSMSGLMNINPSDVESVEVLKDAASAAIYGSRATNGVIIITTKKGRKGEAQVSIDGSVSFSNLTRVNKLRIADSDLFFEVLNESIDNYNLQTGSAVERYTNPMPGVAYHNWFDDILRTAVSYNGSASISGGSDRMTYYVSGNVKHTEGVVINNGVNQYYLKSNLMGQIKPWLSFGINTQLSYTHNNRVPTGYVGANPIKACVEQYPWHEPYLPNGEWATSSNILINGNPLQNILEEDVYVNTGRAISSFHLQFDITEGLNFKTMLGEDFQSLEEHVYYTSKQNYALPSEENPTGGQLIDSRRSRLTLLWENTLSYKHGFDCGINLDAVLGHSVQTYTSTTASQTGMGFPSASFDVNSVASSFKDVSTAQSSYALQSFFGRVNLNYRNRYVMTLTLRADGSSKFAPGNRYGYFPSASIGWNMNEESWWNAPQTSFKVRASWGATGNQEGIGAYAYQALATGGINYNGQSGLGLTTAGNRDLQWEKALQYNLGVDLAFFKGALTMTADVFLKDTKNLLYNKPQMATTGYTSYMCNIGSMRNKGLELTIGGNAGRGAFRWHGDFNISFIRNKLTKLLDDNQIIVVGNGMHALKVGEEIGAFYMIKQKGIYQYDEDVPQYLYENEKVRAGDCIYDDVDNNGIIDSDDRQFVGSPNPKFLGGFNNTFSYKNFELGVFFTYSYGNMLYEMCTGSLRLGNGTYPVMESEALSRWTGPGTSNTTPRAIYGFSWNSTKFVNTRFLHDASYLRCRSVTLGYTFPKKVLQKIGLSSLRLYCQVDNLFVLTPWPYLDPEVSRSARRPRRWATTGSIPRSREPSHWVSTLNSNDHEKIHPYIPRFCAGECGAVV